MIGEHIWLPVVGPELGIGTKNRETISYQSSPAPSEPIAARIVFWLPGLIALEVGVRVLLVSMVGTLSVWVFSHSEGLVPTISQVTGFYFKETGSILFTALKYSLFRERTQLHETDMT